MRQDAHRRCSSVEAEQAGGYTSPSSIEGVYVDEPVKTISRDELRSKLNRGERFVLLETLPKSSYDHAHLPTAKNLPPDKIKNIASLVPDKNAEIIVYCANPT
jgi:hypothetical protein